MAITDLHDGGRLEDVAKVPDQGVTSYKLFMAYKGAIMVDDETLFRDDAGRGQDRRAGHGPRRERRRDRRAGQAGAGRRQDRAALARGHPAADHRGRGDQPGDQARPPRGLPAVRRPRLVRRVHRARGGRPRARDGAPGGRRAPQYLFIDETRLEEPDFAGAKYVYTPPPRPVHNQELLWKALQTGVLSVVSTDHCPFRCQRPEDARAATTSRRSPTAARGSRTGCTCCTTSACARAA